MFPMIRLMRATTLLLICGILLTGCVNTDHADAPVREVTILYTNDEHGWMEGMAPGQSAAHLVDLWKRREGYTADGPFLILSGGDNWLLRTQCLIAK